MIGGKVNLFFHPVRIGFIKKPPCGFFGLVMSRKQRLCLLNQLPFRKALSIPLPIVIIRMP